MAIVVETLVPRASKADAEKFDAAVEAAMMQRGGPPPGLMVHFTRPVGDGFVLSNVWRTEAEMRKFYDDVIIAELASAALDPEESIVSPVWTFARP
ncbi:MAG TPA: hypothetical protein VER39_05940 [Nocardioidaceae bacterium]|nr:hypothetical protein [Nocardioidaceae bacterium]